MTITLRGAVLVASAIFTFILARLTQVGWLYVLDAFLWGSIILSLVLPWLAVMSLSAHRRMVRQGGSDSPSGPSEGELVRVELSLENPKRWPRYLLSASHDCPLAGPGGERQRVFSSPFGQGDISGLGNHGRMLSPWPLPLWSGDCGMPGSLRPVPPQEKDAIAPVSTGIPSGA